MACLDPTDLEFLQETLVLLRSYKAPDGLSADSALRPMLGEIEASFAAMMREAQLVLGQPRMQPAPPVQPSAQDDEQRPSARADSA